LKIILDYVERSNWLLGLRSDTLSMYYFILVIHRILNKNEMIHECTQEIPERNLHSEKHFVFVLETVHSSSF